MNNEEIINTNILCPWSCCTSYLECGKIPLDIMIQRMLPKVLLSTYTNKNQHRYLRSTWNGYYRQSNDEYPDLLLNTKWKIRPSVLLDKNSLSVLTCRFHDNGEDKLYLYPPESPNEYILNATKSDQLSHCVQVPRITKQTKASAYCTKFAMVQCRSGYAGCDTMNITTHSDFSTTSELLSRHEDATIMGRPDMVKLLEQKVHAKQIHPDLAENMIKNARKRYTIADLRKCSQGATYVSFDDMIKIQLFSSSNKQDIDIIKDGEERREVRMKVKSPVDQGIRCSIWP